MPGREEVPEEALEFCNKEREVRLVEAAAPAIRKQERQRIQEALEKLPRAACMGSHEPHSHAMIETPDGDWLDRDEVLDTLDPCGEEFKEPPEDLYRELPHPSGEQGEEAPSEAELYSRFAAELELCHRLLTPGGPIAAATNAILEMELSDDAEQACAMAYMIVGPAVRNTASHLDLKSLEELPATPATDTSEEDVELARHVAAAKGLSDRENERHDAALRASKEVQGDG